MKAPLHSDLLGELLSLRKMSDAIVWFFGGQMFAPREALPVRTVHKL